MPKSFLFTRHKRYEYEFHSNEETTTTNTSSKAPTPKQFSTAALAVKVPFIKSEPLVLKSSEVNGGFKVLKHELELIPSWVSPVTLPQKIEAEDVDAEDMDRDDKYFDGDYVNGKYTRLKIPALVPVRREWKSTGEDFAFRLYDQRNVAADRNVPIFLEHEDDQPVNLTVKKVDLFNLNRLAEVSLATAEGRSFSLTNLSPVTPNSSSLNSTISQTVEDYEMGDLRICESPIPNNPNQIKSSQVIVSDIVSHPIGVLEVEEPPAVATSPSSTSATSACAGRHKCLECGKGFSTLSNLARHRQTHRSLSDSSAVKKCPHCDKVYVSMPAFSMHLRTHNQGCKCPYCGKGFSRPWLLQGHIRTHTGEKPFKCPICAKAFADKSNLRAHTQTHSSEKPFICTRCGKPFALKSYLCKHIESSCMKTSRSPSEKTSSSKSSSSLADPSGTGGDSSCSSFSATTDGSNDNDSS